VLTGCLCLAVTDWLLLSSRVVLSLQMSPSDAVQCVYAVSELRVGTCMPLAYWHTLHGAAVYVDAVGMHSATTQVCMVMTADGHCATV
jgi:hypothetical protein